jgi:hypothetical protein
LTSFDISFSRFAARRTPSAQRNGAAARSFFRGDQCIRLNPASFSPAACQKRERMMRGNIAIVNEMEF